MHHLSLQKIIYAHPRDKIGSIACENEATGHAVGHFRVHLEHDIEKYPERIKLIEPSLAARVAAATKGVDSDAAVTCIVGDVDP